jgi:hypothetical protein
MKKSINVTYSRTYTFNYSDMEGTDEQEKIESAEGEAETMFSDDIVEILRDANIMSIQSEVSEVPDNYFD